MKSSTPAEEPLSGPAMRQRPDPPSTRRLLSILGAFLVVGAPLAMVSWHELSEVLSGRGSPHDMLEGLAAVVALGALAFLLSKAMKGIEA